MKHRRAKSDADASGRSASARNAAYWAIDNPVGRSAASHRRRRDCCTRFTRYPTEPSVCVDCMTGTLHRVIVDNVRNLTKELR